MSDPKAIASAMAQSTVLLSTISILVLRILSTPLWILKSPALGGPDKKRFPMCVSVSSRMPVGFA
jgi:hypothetical protein